MSDLHATTRRRFMTLLRRRRPRLDARPGHRLGADAGRRHRRRSRSAMVTDAMKLSGIELTDAELKAMVDVANQNLKRYEEMRAIHIPNDVSPPFHFSPIVPGTDGQQEGTAVRAERAAGGEASGALSRTSRSGRCGNLGELVRTRQVTSLELTEMYLARLHRYNDKLNNVVTFLDDHGRAEAKHADAEIAAGKYKGPLHGIPWGAKDIISVEGLQDHVGIAGVQGAVVRLRRQRRRDAARRRRGADREAHHRRARERRSVVRRTDQESVGSDAGLERIVGGTLVGDGRRLRRVRDRHRDERIDPEPVGALRPRRAASDLRPHQPLRRDGAVVDAGSARTAVPLRRGLRDRDARDRQAGRPRHERVGHSVQLERAARRQEAARRLHQGVVRRADQRGGETERRGGARHAASDRRDDVHRR